MTQKELNKLLIGAAQNGRTDQVIKLLDAGADINAKINSLTPLIWASSNGHTEILKLLLARGADPNIQDSHGSTALMNAACNIYSDTVRVLLTEKKVDLNRQDKNGQTALIWASFYGRTNIMEILIRAGADPDIRENVLGRTATEFLRYRYPTKYDSWIRNTAVKAREDILLQEDSANNSRQVPDFNI